MRVHARLSAGTMAVSLLRKDLTACKTSLSSCCLQKLLRQQVRAQRNHVDRSTRRWWESRVWGGREVRRKDHHLGVKLGS